MIWDCTTFWCRAGEDHNDLGKIHLCDDCLPPTKVNVDKLMLLDFKYKKDQKPTVSRPKTEPLGFSEPEDGSEARYNKRKTEHPWWKHTGWWLVHNCISHVLIGVLPLKPFFQFHDWTSRKMHGR